MGAPKAEKFPIQLMSLKAIKVDHALQSRVAMSTEHQRKFSEAMRNGREFPPVTLFFDGKTHWLADGFHRHAATIKAGLDSIRSEVREGTRRDAMIFSAGANQEFSIERTSDDAKKAVWMLLDDEEWRKFSPTVIANHIGWSARMVRSFVSEFFKSNNIDEPDIMIYTRKGEKKIFNRAERQRSYDKAAQGNPLNFVRPLGLRSNERGSSVPKEIPYASLTPHSQLDRTEAIAEARRVGDSTPGNGWRRLLWRLADLLEEATAEFGPKADNPAPVGEDHPS